MNSPHANRDRVYADFARAHLDRAALMHETLTSEYQRGASDEDLRARLSELSVGLALRQYHLIDQTIFRARIGVYRTPDDLLYPPSTSVNRCGRFNIAGESLFYCSTRSDTSALEVLPSAGDHVTVLTAHFKSIDPIGVGLDLHSLVGSHVDDFAQALQGRVDLYSHGLPLDELIQSDMANAFFHRLITAPGNSVLHRVTGIFGSDLLRRHNWHALMYPCMASIPLSIAFGAGNLAISPAFVDENATYKSLTIYEVFKDVGWTLFKREETISFDC